jgi:tRNA wybutosine-synthesizing protein 3
MNPALGKSQYPTIAIRSNGLAMDSIIGVLNAESGKVQTVVNEDYIEMLVRVSNMRFTENKCRIQTLIKKLEFALFKNDDMDGWEDKEARRIRKRDEGMKRQMRARLCAIVSDDSENIVEDEIIGLAGIH